MAESRRRAHACAAVLLSLPLLLAGCGGGSGSTRVGAGSAAASLTVRDEAASLRVKAATAFTAAKDGDALAVGDTVRTNGTGFVDVTYRDGSLTRLDADAELTLTDLSQAAQPQRVVGSMNGGRTWSRVQKVTTSDGRFELDTPVATASVRGTRFSIDCTASDGSCTFAVVEGVVRVTPHGGTPVDLTPGQSLTVARDGRATQLPTRGIEVLALASPWIAKNLAIDEKEPLKGPSTRPRSSPSGQALGAPVTVDACTLLTQDEVLAYANTISGDYRTLGPLAVTRNPPDRLAHADALRTQVCTWAWARQVAAHGSSNGGFVVVEVTRWVQGTLGSYRPCSQTGEQYRPISGVGDLAQGHTAAHAGGGFCVLHGDLLIEVSYDGVDSGSHAGYEAKEDELARLVTERAGTG